MDVLPLSYLRSPLICGVINPALEGMPFQHSDEKEGARFEPRHFSQTCIANPDFLGLQILEAETGTQSCLLQRGSQR